MVEIDRSRLPRHIAIIMDGNGRWAKGRGLPKTEGHRAGISAVEEVVKGCLELGVEVLSLYTFSTDNWHRPKKEVSALLRLLEQYLKRFLSKVKKDGIKLAFSGDWNNLPVFLHKQIEKALEQTKSNSKLTLNLALNYGGRQEILWAAKSIARKVKHNTLKVDEISQKLFAEHLYTKGMPDPELLIRTSGEQRVSNFFLWQISYCEFYFTSKLWPDFKKEDLLEALLDYQKRERRFGA